MQTKHRIFDEIAKLAMSGAGIASQMKQDTETYFRKKCEDILLETDFVQREEFDVLRDMIAKARLTQENLEEKIQKLEEEVENLKKTLMSEK